MVAIQLIMYLEEKTILQLTAQAGSPLQVDRVAVGAVRVGPQAASAVEKCALKERLSTCRSCVSQRCEQVEDTNERTSGPPEIRPDPRPGPAHPSTPRLPPRRIL